MDEQPTWPRARLISVTGIGSQKEAETRAASAVLAVLSVARDLSIELFAPMGASRAARAMVEAYTEPRFEIDGVSLRPDGLIRISYGKAVWTALVEVKTGDMVLEGDQLNAYWDLARRQDFDAVVTISNEIAASAGAHPTPGLKVRANSKVAVHHISWTALLSAAVMVKVHRGVDDPEQAWIVGELIRYLEHPASGAMAFDDMGPNWTSVRDAARDEALRRNDDAVRDIAHRWEQLLRYACLHLGSQLGRDVQQVLSRQHRDPKVRSDHLAEAISTGRPLDGILRIPNAAGDVEVLVDLKARRLSAAVVVAAPDDRGGSRRCADRTWSRRTVSSAAPRRDDAVLAGSPRLRLGSLGRCGWMLGQLRSAPPDLQIEAFPKNARVPASTVLSAALGDRDLLLGPEKREPVRFRLVRTTEMGLGRRTGSRSPGFIDSVISAVEQFYGEVVQNLTAWTPRAPRIATSPSTPAGDDEGELAEGSMRPSSPFHRPSTSDSEVPGEAGDARPPPASDVEESASGVPAQ